MSPRSGRLIFQNRCAECHEADGTGRSTRKIVAEMPDFTNRRWQQERSDAQLIASILEGKGARMPAFGGKISKGQARDLIAYIRSFAPTRANAAGRFPTRAKAAAGLHDDFEKRLRQLQEEYDQLRQQIQALSREPQRKR